VGCGVAALAIAAAGVTGGAGSAQAQDADGDAGANAEQIIVTGSRLSRSTFDTPTPVTVLGADALEDRAVKNVGEALNDVPAFRASTTPVTQGFGSFNVGANIVNLRGIGTTRNLVLVDGRRFAPSTREGSVDLNLIPSVLVDRIEVVTGGASAAYGSDAIAGAVNVILDKSLEGIKGQVDFGISQQGDGEDYHAALAYGTKLGDRGHFVIGGEYDNQKGIGNCFTRDWCKPASIVTNTGYASNNGYPNLVRSDDNAGWFMNSSGVVSLNNNTSAATAAIVNLFGTGGITFASDGTPVAYNPGSPRFALGQVGGDLYPTYNDANITVPVERYSVFAHADYEFSDSLSGFVEASYGHIRGELLQTSYFTTNLPITIDNPYIPDAIRAIVGARPDTPSDTPGASVFVLGRVLDDVGRGLSISKADSYRGTVGLKGDLGSGWEWDAYYQYGRTDRLQTVENNLVTGDPSLSRSDPDSYAAANARFYYALDAVIDPGTGNPTCRALLSTNAALREAAAGCVPINLFGSGNVSQAAKDYIFATLTEDIRLEQHVVAANIRGDLAQLWAGPLSFAAGAEFRSESIDVVHDDLSNQYAYFQNFGSDYNGKTDVLEGYAELGLPLVRDASWTKSLSLDGAVRVTNYDIEGFGSYLRTNSKNEFTKVAWKVSGLWEPVDWLRFRASLSRDIRAPNFAELYLASASTFTPITNRFNLTQAVPPTIIGGGSPDLRPEAARTLTLGGVLSPHGALDGLRLSLDWYRIKVKDYISTAPGGVQQIVDRCYAGNEQACSLISFGADDTITQITNIAINLDRITAEGFDIEAEYRIPLGNGDNSLTLRGIATHVSKLESVSFGQVIDRAGQNGQTSSSTGVPSIAAPNWVLNGYLTFDSPAFSFTLQGRYISPGHFDNSYIGPDDPDYSPTLINSINDNMVDGRFYVNLFATLRLGGDRTSGFELFGAVNNLFDKDPPAAPETQFYTNPIYYDTIGRYFRIGARVKY